MKKLNKKLTLNKETISRLNDEQMDNVKGGFTYTISLGERCIKSAHYTDDPAACKTK